MTISQNIRRTCDDTDGALHRLRAFVHGAELAYDAQDTPATPEYETIRALLSETLERLEAITRLRDREWAAMGGISPRLNEAEIAEVPIRGMEGE